MNNELKELYTGKIVNILAQQASITAQGRDYKGELDWALNKILALLQAERTNIVAEISGLKQNHFIDEDGTRYCNLPHEYCDTCTHNQALDQAIDIVKSNK